MHDQMTELRQDMARVGYPGRPAYETGNRSAECTAPPKISPINCATEELLKAVTQYHEIIELLRRKLGSVLEDRPQEASTEQGVNVAGCCSLERLIRAISLQTGNGNDALRDIMDRLAI